METSVKKRIIDCLLEQKKCNGLMGVPISFLDKYCVEQFTVIGLLQSSTEELAGTQILRTYNEFKEMRQDMTYTGASGQKANGNPVLQGKSSKGNFLYNQETGEYVHSAYARVLIRSNPSSSNKDSRQDNARYGYGVKLTRHLYWSTDVKRR